MSFLGAKSASTLKDDWSLVHCSIPQRNLRNAKRLAVSEAVVLRSSRCNLKIGFQSMATKQNSDEAVRHRKRWSEVPLGDRWRAALIRLPRSFPKLVLRASSPQGPHPTSVAISSRFQNHSIPLWIFLPPIQTECASNGYSSVSASGHARRRTVPVHVDFHGGNFIMGGPMEQAAFCARIARERSCVVIGVDYCLGPLYEYPSALEDAEDVIRAVLDSEGSSDAGRTLHQAILQGNAPSGRRAKADIEELMIDPKQLSLSGFSSGGNLALNLVLSTSNTSPSALPRSRERADDETPTIPLDRDTTKRQNTDWLSCIPLNTSPIPVFLFYPQLEQQSLAYDRAAPSEAPIARPGRFGTSVEKRLARTYIPEHIRSHPRASPGLAPASAVHDKARFFVVLPEQDSLTYHAHDWVRKMRSAGWTEAELRTFDAPRTPHGFFNLPDRKLDRHTFEVKQGIYASMMEFWREQVR